MSQPTPKTEEDAVLNNIEEQAKRARARFAGLRDPRDETSMGDRQPLNLQAAIDENLDKDVEQILGTVALF